MNQTIQTIAPIKSALFVDFDNIYIGLSKTDPQAAERFAADPARWLAWLERGLPSRLANDSKAPGQPTQRSILIRRCYPNPDAGFRRFRSFFTSSAFSVIDCPSLTRTGKNSSDIYMVMDILDTLSHKTNFDEFIIFSGDSDFMPVLLRLRAHDRRTTTLAIDFMPPAYKAACDLVISEEEFIEDALGVTHEANCNGNGPTRTRVPAQILKDMATRVYDTVCSEGEVAGSSLPEILKDFREFRESTNWLGFGTSQRLAEALICSEQRLQLVRVNPLMYKLVLKTQAHPAQHLENQPAVLFPLAEGRFRRQLAEEDHAAAEKAPVVERPMPVNKVITERSGKAEQIHLRTQVVNIVKEMVAESRSALLLARVSQFVVNKLGPQVLDSQWGGAGSFKRLLQGTNDLGLEITTQPEPGYIFDPQRHIPPTPRHGRVAASEKITSEEDQALAEAAEAVSETASDPTGDAIQPVAVDLDLHDESSPNEAVWLEPGFEDDEEDAEEDEAIYEEAPPNLDEFIRRVSQVTGAPDLSPQQYAQVFRGIVSELQQIALGQKTYSTYQSSKSVSDWCAEHGENVARGDLVQVFRSIIFQDGARFGRRPGSYTEEELANIVRNNIKGLCKRSQMELSEYEDRLLEEWILSGLEEIGPTV